MRLTINGQVREVPEGLTLSGVVRHLGMAPAAAIVVNGELVPRVRHGDVVVREGDVVELVQLPSGG